jgi:hypothetical protein
LQCKNRSLKKIKNKKKRKEKRKKESHIFQRSQQRKARSPALNQTSEPSKQLTELLCSSTLIG